MAVPEKPIEEEEDEEDLNGEDDDDDDDEVEEEEEDEEEEDLNGEDDDDDEVEESKLVSETNRLTNLFNQLPIEKITLRVHDVLINGNTKTKDSLIEQEIGPLLKEATTMQELLDASSIVSDRLKNLDIFESVDITLDAGPSELPGTANVIIEVVEIKNPLNVDLGIFSKPEARSWSLEGSLKVKNLFGYGDIWDGLGAYSWDPSSEVSAGVSLPRFRGFETPLTTRVSLLSQDWLKFSSYKERLFGISLGLLSTRHHDLAYHLTWRNLTDPSQLASRSIRMQLGHSLLSSLKYTFKIDRRNSSMRPTRGYAFSSTTQFGGLSPDSRSLQFLRQEFDLRYAFPLGLYNAALNFGVSAGVIFPWGSGFMNKQSPLPYRFFLGGHSSPVCSLGGPTTLLGFKSRGLGPTEPRRLIPDSDNESSTTSPGRDVLGGDLAVTAFADLSFNLPLRLFREAGIHGHVFACAGNLNKLTENEFRDFSLKKFRDSFRSSAGFGVIVPTRLLRMEINYCYILKQLEHDRGKTGIQFSFSSPYHGVTAGVI